MSRNNGQNYRRPGKIENTEAPNSSCHHTFAKPMPPLKTTCASASILADQLDHGIFAAQWWRRPRAERWACIARCGTPRRRRTTDREATDRTLTQAAVATPDIMGDLAGLGARSWPQSRPDAQPKSGDVKTRPPKCDYEPRQPDSLLYVAIGKTSSGARYRQLLGLMGNVAKPGGGTI